MRRDDQRRAASAIEGALGSAQRPPPAGIRIVAPSAHAYLPIDRRSTDSRRQPTLMPQPRGRAACAASALGLGVFAYSQGRWTGYYLELLFASSVPGDVAEYRVTTPGTPLLTFIPPRIPCVRDSTHARTHARTHTPCTHAHPRTHCTMRTHARTHTTWREHDHCNYAALTHTGLSLHERAWQGLRGPTRCHLPTAMTPSAAARWCKHSTARLCCGAIQTHKQRYRFACCRHTEAPA